MADERRYNEDEVAAIFEEAAAPTVSRGETPPAEGLTLAELQSIGREVGIAPERIANAATAFERRPVPIPRRRDFGMPMSAAHIVEIPRPLTDREWSLVVADLRETFGARGKESSHGETREWTNGNLHAFVEPTQTGYRLRLGSLKGDAFALNRLGAFGMVMGLVVSSVALLTGDPGTAFPGVMLGSMGAGAFAYNALRLPRWARLREEQMRSIAERTRALIASRSDTNAD